MPTKLERSSIHLLIHEVIRQGNRWKPDVYVIEKDGRKIVVKDYAKNPFIFRVTVGIFSCWREAYIYKKLQGIKGILECLGLVDRYAILINYVPSENAKDVKPEALTPLFFKKMRATIDAVHERGVVLCDLRNIKNTLVGEGGEPYLIDFSTAFLKGGRFNLLRNGIFSLFFQDDLLSIPKIKHVRVPQLLTEEERLALEQGIFLEKEAKFIKKHGRSLLRWIFGLGSKYRKHSGNEGGRGRAREVDLIHRKAYDNLEIRRENHEKSTER